MKPGLWLSLGLWLLLAAIPAWGRRDPLSNAEVEQLRDVAQQPEKRLPLYVQFVQSRMDTVGQLRDDPRFTADRTARIHDLLEDVDTLVQELDDNIDVYVQQNMDIRKPLRTVIDMNSALEQRLRAIKRNSKPEELTNFGFALDNAIASVVAIQEDARQVEQEQEEAVKNNKKK
jgi:hypothetical protein